MRHLSAIAVGLIFGPGVGSCASAPMRQGAAVVVFVTDSSRFVVRQEGGMYRTQIGYRVTNHTAWTLSQDFCSAPGPHTLEKNVGGGWVLAYSPVLLSCLAIPPFRLRTGGTYRGTFAVVAGPRAGGIRPELRVDSIPGTYRLRWGLRVGDDPDDAGQPVIEMTSNEFQLVGR